MFMVDRRLRPRGLVALAAALFVLAAGAVFAGTMVLRGAPSTSGTSFEVGKWLLQLGTVFAGTGLITAALRQVEVTRADRAAWTTLLQDLVVAQEAIEGACMRLASDGTAQTYAELIERCHEMRAMLRRIIALPQVNPDSELRRHASRLRRCLKPLVKEYERQYLRVTRQALLDEKVLQKLVEGAPEPPPAELFAPRGVSRFLADEKAFPSLAALRKDFDEAESQFREDSEIDDAYEGVKGALRRHAGGRARR